MADAKDGRAPKKTTKNGAVRQALTELGMDATRIQIQDFVKERFGYEMSMNHISAARVKARPKKVAPPKPAPTKPVAVAESPAPTSSGKATIHMDDLLAIQALVKRLGAGHLRELIDVLN